MDRKALVAISVIVGTAGLAACYFILSKPKPSTQKKKEGPLKKTQNSAVEYDSQLSTRSTNQPIFAPSGDIQFCSSHLSEIEPDIVHNELSGIVSVETHSKKHEFSGPLDNPNKLDVKDESPLPSESLDYPCQEIDIKEEFSARFEILRTPCHEVDVTDEFSASSGTLVSLCQVADITDTFSAPSGNQDTPCHDVTEEFSDMSGTLVSSCQEVVVEDGGLEAFKPSVASSHATNNHVYEDFTNHEQHDSLVELVDFKEENGAIELNGKEVVSETSQNGDVTKLIEDLKSLSDVTNSSLTNEDGALLLRCLQKSYEIWQSSNVTDSMHESWSTLLRSILGATAFSPNIEILIHLGLYDLIWKQLVNVLTVKYEEDLTRIVRILVNIFPHQFYSDSSAKEDEAYWQTLKTNLDRLLNQVFQADIPFSLDCQLACLQLLTNVSAQSDRHPDKLLPILNEYCQTLIFCALNVNIKLRKTESVESNNTKLQSLALSCLLHMSTPLPGSEILASIENADEIYLGSLTLLKTKTSMQISLWLNREISARLHPELQEKWLRILIHLYRYMEICEQEKAKDLMKEEDNLFHCLHNSRLQLMSSVFFLEKGESERNSELAVTLLGLLQAL